MLCYNIKYCADSNPGYLRSFFEFFFLSRVICNSRFHCRGFNEVVSRCLDFTQASIQCRTEGALLLTGARGSGKTTLVSCILRRLSKDRWCYTHKIDSKMLRGWCFCSHTVIEFRFCFSDFLSIRFAKYYSHLNHITTVWICCFPPACTENYDNF